MKKPIICYRRNKNLRNLIGGNILSKNEVVRKGIPTKLIQGKCSPVTQGIIIFVANKSYQQPHLEVQKQIMNSKSSIN